MPRQTLHAVLAERSGVSVEMALRLGALLGNGAQLWVDMQSKYDLWQAEAKLHDERICLRPMDQLALAWQTLPSRSGLGFCIQRQEAGRCTAGGGQVEQGVRCVGHQQHGRARVVFQRGATVAFGLRVA